MQIDIQEQGLTTPGTGTPDVALEYGDGLWFVAVRRSEPHPLRYTHERQRPGYASPDGVVEAACRYAAEHGLSIDSRAEMLDDIAETLRSFEADKTGFEE